ncbi:MAG: enoyl-CoA hydratase/isomerase family protein [Acidimicrobiales bacterium]
MPVHEQLAEREHGPLLKADNATFTRRSGQVDLNTASCDDSVMANIRISHSEDRVATITLDRPHKKNALSMDLREEMVDALEHLRTDDSVNCLIVTGEGDAFSAGFDLSEFTNDDEAFQKRLWDSSDRFHHALLRFPLPIIAAVNGVALAGGFDLAVLCDLRIASRTAHFGHPERSFGDVVYRPLLDLVGGAVARDLCLTGRTIDAHEAHELGLVSRVVASEELIGTVEEMASRIAAFPREMSIRIKAKIIASVSVDPSTRTLDL